MSDISTQPIVVGVSGAGASDGALRFAVDEAIRQRCGITIVHALSESLAPPPGDPLSGFASRSESPHRFVDGSDSAEAYRLVTDTARRARAESHGRVAVDSRVLIGHHVRAIVNAAENARLIVLQHHDLPVFERIFVHSTSVGVSGRAHCPVVTVPPVWDPDFHRDRVVVGISRLDDSADVLRIAFESAERRRAKLDVVHAWTLMSSDGDVMSHRSAGDERQGRSESELAELVTPWIRQFPTVKVEQHVVHQGAVEALIDISRDSDLLVLGRFRASLPLPLPLGSIARAMVSGGHCPVEVVPHSEPTRQVVAGNGRWLPDRHH